MVTYIVSLAVLILLIGGLSALWIIGGNDPTSFEIQAQLSEAEMRENAYYLPVAVTNLGDQSAQEVTVNVISGDETRTFSIALIPGGATRIGTVVFSRDPAVSGVKTEVVSYISS